MSDSRWSAVVLHENVGAAYELFHSKTNEPYSAKGVVYPSPTCFNVAVESKVRQKAVLDRLQALFCCIQIVGQSAEAVEYLSLKLVAVGHPYV